jgi:hypothetical protein
MKTTDHSFFAFSSACGTAVRGRTLHLSLHRRYDVRSGAANLVGGIILLYIIAKCFMWCGAGLIWAIEKAGSFFKRRQ